MGSAKPRVDIVIFPAGERHGQANAYILIETKKPGTSPQDKTGGIGQLQSYMAACPNAYYGLWTNGDDRFCLAKRVKAGKILFEEIVDIPAAGQSEADAARPRRTDLMPATADNLLFAFRRCHNYIAGTEGMQKPEVDLTLRPPPHPTPGPRAVHAPNDLASSRGLLPGPPTEPGPGVCLVSPAPGEAPIPCLR